MIEFTIEGLDALAKRLGVDLKPAMKAATFAVGWQLHARVSRGAGKSGKPSHSPVLWSSEKQRRWYFAMRRREGLPDKYSRGTDPKSQKLEQSWVVAPYGDTGAVVGTRGVTYAKWVQSSEMQWGQHKATGWITDAEAVAQLKRDNVIEPIVRDAIEHALNV